MERVFRSDELARAIRHVIRNAGIWSADWADRPTSRPATFMSGLHTFKIHFRKICRDGSADDIDHAKRAWKIRRGLESDDLTVPKRMKRSSDEWKRPASPTDMAAAHFLSDRPPGGSDALS
jgi:hypothetical protein